MKSPPRNRSEVPALSRFLDYCKTRLIPARTMIIHAGDEPDCLYYLLDGSVEVVIEDEDGDEMVLAYLNDGHFFGEMGFFYERSIRTAWVRSRTPCELAEMNYPAFKQLTESSPELVVEVAAQIASRIAYANLKVADLAFLDVTGRVAHALIDLTQEPDAHRSDVGVRIRLTRPQLAKIVGCSREMASRVLKSMESQGMISGTPDGVVVLKSALGSYSRDLGHQPA